MHDSGLMFAEPLGVASAALAFNTRSRHDDADAGGRGAYGNAGEDFPVHAPGFRRYGAEVPLPQCNTGRNSTSGHRLLLGDPAEAK
jgi:hypothetical protein